MHFPIFQAQQDVPEFLEAAADSAVGTFHGSAGGSFGGRDTRKVRRTLVVLRCGEVGVKLAPSILLFM